MGREKQKHPGRDQRDPRMRRICPQCGPTGRSEQVVHNQHLLAGLVSPPGSAVASPEASVTIRNSFLQLRPDDTVCAMADTPRVRLGELLVQAGVLTNERLQEALAIQQGEPTRRRLGQVLVDRAFVNETQLAQVLGRQLAVPWVSLYHVDFSRQLLNLVPREIADAFILIPVYVRHVRGQGDTLYVATDDPTNEEGLRRVGAYAGLPVRPMIAAASDIRAAIRVYYGGGTKEAAPASLRPPASVRQSAPPRPPPPSNRPKPAEPRISETKIAAVVDAEVLPTTVRYQVAATTPIAPPEPSPMVVDVGIPAVEAPIRVPKTTLPSIAPPVLEPVAPARSRAERIEAVLARGKVEDADGPDQAPELESQPIHIPEPVASPKKKRSVAFTLFDGTEIRLPIPKGKKQQEDESPPSGEHDLTARDLIAALRAVSHGADAGEVLGENPRWEPLFVALLSLLLKKHLIADWEFVEEYKKV